MIDVKYLRYFVAVATERSFTKGAEQLNMAQPPLSRRIQEMEEELGIRLFNREARPLTLTPAGQLLYEEAVQIIRRVGQMHTTMNRFIVSERTPFVIGLVPSTLYARLPEVIRRFRERALSVDLSLVEMSSLEQIAALREGSINVGFGRVRLDEPGIMRRVLREERLVVALPPDHPLVTSDGPLELSVLADMPIIIYPREPRPSYADQVLSFFHDHGIKPSSTILVRELQTAMVMVAAGGGACIVPESVQHLGRSDMIFRRLAQQGTSPIIMSHRVNDRSLELRIFYRTFLDLYAEWGWPVPQMLMDELEGGHDGPSRPILCRSRDDVSCVSGLHSNGACQQRDS